MPEDDYVWLPKASILTFEEIARLAGIFAGLGAGKVRLTGGEPLLRQDLPELVRLLAATRGVDDLALTTNGILLAEHATALKAAGLRRVTVSLDTLQPDRFFALTRSKRHTDVLAGIAAARAAFGSVKLNTVVLRGTNDDEIVPLLDFARAHGAEVRFIEYMDVGGATRWSSDAVVSRADILARIAAHVGPVVPLAERATTGAVAAPAERFQLADGRTFGIIASTTAPFCRTCDRSRITADGMWFLCLYAAEGADVKALLRDGSTDADIAARIRAAWTARDDRGAEERLAAPQRGALYQIESLRSDPHREMHTRGG
jgi:cyclic pyranopterin phosphate synthase